MQFYYGSAAVASAGAVGLAAPVVVGAAGAAMVVHSDAFGFLKILVWILRVLIWGYLGVRVRNSMGKILRAPCK